MTATIQKSKKEKLKRLPHFLSACIILLHGFERWETGHGTYLFFVIAGLIFLSIAIFHHLLSARFPLVDVVFYLIESFLSLIIAYEYFTAGKQSLPFAYLFAAILQLAAIYVFYRKNKKQGELS